MNIQDFKPGMIVYAKVTGIKPYGFFVQITDKISGMVHISEISNLYVSNILKFVSIGQYLFLKVTTIDLEHKQLRLSLKTMPKKRLNSKRRKLVPQNYLGFKTLEKKLDTWIKEAL